MKSQEIRQKSLFSWHSRCSPQTSSNMFKTISYNKSLKISEVAKEIHSELLEPQKKHQYTVRQYDDAILRPSLLWYPTHIQLIYNSPLSSHPLGPGHAMPRLSFRDWLLQELQPQSFGALGLFGGTPTLHGLLVGLCFAWDVPRWGNQWKSYEIMELQELQE